MNFLRCIAAIASKDLLSEFRRRETFNTLLFFGVLIVFLFSFAMGPNPEILKQLAPGLLWLVVIFSSVLALERSFQSEVEEGCLDRLILYAASPRALFLGKLLTNLLFILTVQMIVLLLMIVLFDLGSPAEPRDLAATMLLGDLGVATLGTFYSALITKMKARQAMLPLLLFPMLIPLLLASVYATQYALGGGLFNPATPWVPMLLIFDAVFLSASLLTVETLLEA